MEFTAVDGGAAIIVLLSGILAYARGFVRETLAILAWVAGAVAAYYFAPQLEPLVTEIPVIGEFLADSCEIATIAAFTGVFVIALLVLSIFTPLFSGAVQKSAVGSVDQALGFLFGVARGLLLIAIALVVYDRVVSAEPIPMIDNSQTAEIFAQIQDQLNENIPTDAPNWFKTQYAAFVSHCDGNSLLTPETAPEQDSTGTDDT